MIREALYYFQLCDGTDFVPPEELLDIARGWRLFQARQYERVALEALWVALLKSIEQGKVAGFRVDSLVPDAFAELDEEGFAADHGLDLPRPLSEVTLAEYAAALMEADGYRPAKAAAWIRAARDSEALPFDKLGPQSAHGEAGWKRAIDVALPHASPATVIGAAVSLLVVIWLRFRRFDPQGQAFGRFLSFGGRGRLSLSTLISEFDRWMDLPLVRLSSFLVEEWALGQHLRVSLHKLHVEGLDTFWVRAGEDGYEIHPKRDVGDAWPKYNGYKIGAALSCLEDLALVGRNSNGEYHCTDDGKRLRDRVIAVSGVA